MERVRLRNVLEVNRVRSKTLQTVMAAEVRWLSVDRALPIAGDIPNPKAELPQLPYVNVPLSPWIFALLAALSIRIVSDEWSSLRKSFFSDIGNFLLRISHLGFAQISLLR